MNIGCVIPARYESTRLPGKPLLDIAGKPMIQHVVEKVWSVKGIARILVATDDKRIVDAVRSFGGEAIMTSPDHRTGTDRIAEVAQKFTDMDVLVNVQGDEPLIRPEAVELLVAEYHRAKTMPDMATLATIMPETEKNNPAAVKVAVSQDGYALYFSRSLIPYPRVSMMNCPVMQHIGIYAYRREFLIKFAALPQTPLEETESLEQLRALEHGYRIKVLMTDYHSTGVDTPEQLEKVRRIMSA